MDITADMDFKNSREMSQELLAETAASIRSVLVSQGHQEANVE
jgi:hypothetical protein